MLALRGESWPPGDLQASPGPAHDRRRRYGCPWLQCAALRVRSRRLERRRWCPNKTPNSLPNSGRNAISGLRRDGEPAPLVGHQLSKDTELDWEVYALLLPALDVALLVQALAGVSRWRCKGCSFRRPRQKGCQRKKSARQPKTARARHGAAALAAGETVTEGTRDALGRWSTANLAERRQKGRRWLWLRSGSQRPQQQNALGPLPRCKVRSVCRSGFQSGLRGSNVALHHDCGRPVLLGLSVGRFFG